MSAILPKHLSRMPVETWLALQFCPGYAVYLIIIQPDVREDDHHGVSVLFLNFLQTDGSFRRRGARTAKKVHVTKIRAEIQMNST